MKNILLIITFILLGLTIKAQYQVPDYVQNFTSTKPTVYAVDLGGGYQQVADSTAKADLSSDKRVVGMMVSYKDNGFWVTERYEGTDVLNTNWRNDANWNRVVITDTLQYYLLATDIRQEISDSINSYNFPSFGTDKQIPFIDPTGNDLIYTDKFTYDSTNNIFNIDLSTTDYFQAGIEKLEFQKRWNTEQEIFIFKVDTARFQVNSSSDFGGINSTLFMDMDRYNASGNELLYKIGGSDKLRVGNDSANFSIQVNADSIKLYPTSRTTHKEGLLSYDNTTKSLVFQNDISDFNHNLGYEHVRRVYNGTGSTISNGKLIRKVGVYINGDVIASVALAGNSTLDSARVYGMATVDILTGTVGIATRNGDVRGLDLSAYNDTSGYLGFAGAIIDTCPPPPYQCVYAGEILYNDNDSGTFDVDIALPMYSPNPTFSASFEDSSILITNPGLSTYAPITNGGNNLYTEKRNAGFTFQGDSISPRQSGNYTILYSYSFQGVAVQTDLFRIGVFIDGVKGYSSARTASGTNTGGVPFPYTVFLNAGQWISFKISNESDATRSATFIDGAVTINYSQ